MKRRRRRGKVSDRQAGRGKRIYRYQLGSEGDGVERFDGDEDENEDQDRIESSEGDTEEIEDQAGSSIEAEGESLGQIVDIQWCEERFEEAEEDCWTRTHNRRARYPLDSAI